MGVAVIASVWTSRPLSVSARRCSTPKRCCSSMTARRRSAKATASWNSAWVPTTTGKAPEASAASTLRREPARPRPVNRPTSSPAGSSRAPSVSKCCCARISVGAMTAAWPPASCAAAAASAATTVLPLPTSPWRRRIMRWPEARSPPISASARRCAPVSWKGKCASTARQAGPSSAKGRAALRR